MTFQKAFTLFKYSVYALLAVNIYLFFLHTTVHEGLDCVGWLMLLMMFEWETRKKENAPHSPAEKVILWVWQATAYALVLYAWGKYYLHGQWLDFINASLWLGVILTIAIDVYRNGQGQWHAHWLHHAVKFALYAGLIAIAVIWGMQGDILNFYDAFLWIVCFFAIELNLLQHANHAWQRVRRRKTR